MNGNRLHIDQFSLIENVKTGHVHSFRHLVRTAAEAYSMNAHDATVEITELVKKGELKLSTDGNPSIPTCLECGCTEQFACEGGCSWAGPNVCSSCLAPQMKPRDEIEDKLDAMQRQRDLTGYERLAVMQIELLLDIRDLLSAAFVPPTLRGTPEQIARLKELFAEDAPRGRILTLG